MYAIRHSEKRQTANYKHTQKSKTYRNHNYYYHSGVVHRRLRAIFTTNSRTNPYYNRTYLFIPWTFYLFVRVVGYLYYIFILFIILVGYTFFERPRDDGARVCLIYICIYARIQRRAGRFEAISHLPVGNL